MWIYVILYDSWHIIISLSFSLDPKCFLLSVTLFVTPLALAFFEAEKMKNLFCGHWGFIDSPENTKCLIDWRDAPDSPLTATQKTAWGWTTIRDFGSWDVLGSLVWLGKSNLGNQKRKYFYMFSCLTGNFKVQTRPQEEMEKNWTPQKRSWE